jgi:hypothetical protein
LGSKPPACPDGGHRLKVAERLGSALSAMEQTCSHSALKVGRSAVPETDRRSGAP